MASIAEAFAPVLGQHAWNVRKGIGSFLTFEFGRPTFHILRQPNTGRTDLAPRQRLSLRLKRHRRRRLVAIQGDWHLWIYLCQWRFYWGDELVGTSRSSPAAIKQIALDLDGQILTQVEVDAELCTVFTFDLGGRLETRPDPSYEQAAGEPVDQWLLYAPDGQVLSLRSDGKFRSAPGSLPDTGDDWQTLTE